MTWTVERTDARDRPQEQLERLFSEGFPEFITADRVVTEYIGRVREWFADLDLMLVDGDRVPVAAGWGVPLHWDGEVSSLPAGYTDSLVRAVEGRERGRTPNTLVVCGAVVTPALQGRGLAGRMLTALRETGRAAGLTHVLAPVRPTTKERYPLTPIERFMTWRREDGTALDPWIRTHERLGATVLAAAPASQTMTGSVTEWEKWTGLALPESGEYVIPGGLTVLHVDRAAGTGVYQEPNIWMRHP
ncbi:GNAT family N-acetyltransferase [Streptomyces sp. NPDC046887]|uniref:GNAT family N-acetyltransferase n=1 Tax=Streptomyces sp. NPDC046887 TaxID=3155472 RepID=UPI0033DA115F